MVVPKSQSAAIGGSHQGRQHHADHVGKLTHMAHHGMRDRTDLDSQNRKSLPCRDTGLPHRDALAVEGRIETIGMVEFREASSSTRHAS